MSKITRHCAYALACIGGMLAAGCHHSTIYDSNYGIGWVTVANGTGIYGNNVQFASYVVTIDSITLVDAVGNQYTAMGTPEPVDFVKLSNIAELWGSASIPADTYVSAIITVDYTNAAVALLVNGVPTPAMVKIPGDATLTTDHDRRRSSIRPTRSSSRTAMRARMHSVWRWISIWRPRMSSTSRRAPRP